MRRGLPGSSGRAQDTPGEAGQTAEKDLRIDWFESVLKFFDCHFSLDILGFLPFRFSVVLFLNHKKQVLLLLRFKLQSLKNVSHNTLILKQSNSNHFSPASFKEAPIW